MVLAASDKRFIWVLVWGERMKSKQAQGSFLRLSGELRWFIWVLRIGQYAQGFGPANGLRPAINAKLAINIVSMHLDRTQ